MSSWAVSRLWTFGYLIAALGAGGCSTHTLNLKYEPSVPIVAPANTKSIAIVGSIRDDRDEESTWFGAIRGGYGNPLKKLHTDQPISTVVSTALADALQRRGLLSSPETATVRIDGSVSEFQCNYYWNRDAQVHLSLNVVDIASNNILFTQVYKTETKESGVGAGIFGNVEHLASFTQQTMNQTIDKALADPALVAAVTGQRTDFRKSATHRLKELETLRRDGLISESEYETKRMKILGEL